MPIDKNLKFRAINIAVITISDTREDHNDTSGNKIVEFIDKMGHKMIEKRIVKDDITSIRQAIKNFTTSGNVDAVITTGGTGLTGRDVTPEALEGIADKHIPGFGELFRRLSYDKISTSTIQSRACAGVVDNVYVFCLPGSNGAVKDAFNFILIDQLDIRHKPCNFIEIMPRLKER